MAIVSDVEIRLRADIARLQQDLTRARGQVSSFTSSVKSLMGGLFAGFSIAAVVSQVVGAQRQFDKLNSSLITATGSSANAGAAFDALQKLAARTPYSLQEVTEGFLKLRNMGLTPSERAIMSYGNTAAAMGKNLNMMVEAVADAATGEFERLKEFGIKAKQNGDRVALTFQGTTKTIGNNAKEIEEYLLAIGEVQFAGGMERQAATLDGALSNLGDTWDQTLTAFSQSGFGDVVHGSVLALTGALSDLGAMFKAVRGAAEDEGKKVSEIGPLHSALTTIFETVTVLGLNVSYVLTAVGKDIGAVVAAATALASGDFAGYKRIGEMRRADAEKERAEVDAASARILGAAAKNQAVRAKEAEDRKNGVKDALEQYKIQGNGVKTLSDAQKKAAADAAKAEAKRLQAYRDLESQVDARVASTARELAGLKELSDAEKFDIDLTEKLRLKKISLTEAEEKHIRARNQEAGINAILAASNKEYEELQARLAANARELAQEREGLVDSAREEAEQNEWLVKTFGMTEAAITRMEAARIREQLVQKLGRDLTAEEIADLERVAELKERSAKAVANRAELEQVRGFWTDIEQTAHDTFKSIADGGKDLGKRLRDTLKNTFFDWLYQQTLRKWIINVGTSVSGTAGVSGIANAADLVGGGSGGFLSSLMGGLDGITGVSSMARMGLTSEMGVSIGNGIASVVGPELAGALSSGLSSLAAAAPWVAGAVAVYTLAKKAFGMGPKEFTGTSTLSGWITSNGSLDANNYVDWEKRGGWLRSDKTGSDRQAVNSELAAGVLSTYETIKASTMQYAAALGVNADFVKDRAQGISIALGQDEAANQKAITQFFSDAADHIAREVLPSMALFTRQGESAAQTLQRMATNAAGVDQVFAALGTTTVAVFGEVSNVSMLARERLVDMAGGVQNLATMVGYFQQNILTEADRVAAVQGPLQKALESLGYASLKTTDDYKVAVLDLMKTGALATEEGAKKYAGLLALAPQFKMVADFMAQMGDAVEETVEELPNLDLLRHARELSIQILELEGNATAALAEQRKLEKEQTDASLHPLLERIHALQDEAAAAERLAEVTRANGEMLTGLVDQAMAALGRAVQAQKDRVTTAYQDSMKALEKNITEVNATIERTGALSKALRGAIGAPVGDNAMRGQIARADITAALAIARASGVLPTADSLAAALATVTQDDTDDFATLQEYQRAVARTNAELEALGGLSDKELTTAEKQLKALEDQKTTTEAAYQAELQRLDKILEQAQAQVDAVKGVDNSVRSVEAALGALGTALGALKTAPTPTNSGGITGGGKVSVEDLYRQVLGRDGDAAGIAFWKKTFGDAVDQSEYQEFIKGAKTELENVVNAPPTVATGSGTMGGNSAMLSELQTLNARMATVEAATANTATATQQFAFQFNQVSAGGNILATEAIT